MIPKSCRLFGQDHAAMKKSNDPEKLQKVMRQIDKDEERSQIRPD
jgi:hypothetical protein